MIGLEYDPVMQCALQDAVNRLPGTPSSIAAQMSARGITGRRRKATSCVIANYVRAELGGLIDDTNADHRVTSGTITATVMIDGRAVASVDLPEAVTAFVDGFDQGEYAALDADLVLVA